MKTQINEIKRMQFLAGLISESQLNEAEDLQQFATKLAAQHNLILMPQPLGKAQLFSMYQKEKGSFGDKNGVMTYEPSSKVVNVLSNDEKIPAAVYAQFKADKGGNDAGFETKTFAEKDAQIAYFKNFQIAESQLSEAAELDSNEQELVDAVMGDINEAIDLGKILKKVKALANKGLLTVAMASTILASCGTAGSSDEMFKRELENLKKVDSIENVQKARIDSISQAIRSNPTTATIK
jgi:hypothetical protein